MSETGQDRLDSWKAIAAYLKRDERTVRRWEQERSLPVHRMPGGGRAAVYAFRGEIDLWLRDGHAQLDSFSLAVPTSKAWYRKRSGIAALLALAALAAGGTAVWLRVRRSQRQRPEEVAQNPQGVLQKPERAAQEPKGIAQRPTASTQRPLVIMVTFNHGRGKSLGFHLDGLGFGNPPVRLPATRTLPYFRIGDVSCFAENVGHCEAGYEEDDYKLTYTSWSNSQIVVDNYTVASPGDAVEVAVWKPGSSDPQDAAAWGGNIPPLKPGTPHISNVTFRGAGKNLRITVEGSGFGDAPPGVPGTGTTAFLQLADFAYHSPSASNLANYFRAGYSGENGMIDSISLVYSGWTDSKIQIDGFGGDYGYNGLGVRSGDPVAIELWSTRTRFATVWGGRVQ
ncbi:MAG TPA: hypothetical protein VGW33_12970 [Terriglobia bacterium]|nr:hypothetical protein [Terriglobia bacterium]